MEETKYIPVEIVKEIVETLWKYMDTEWTPAREAYYKCLKLIENNAIPNG